MSSIASLLPEAGGPSRSTTALCSALAEGGLGVKILSLDLGTAFQPAILPSSKKVETSLIPCKVSKRLRLQWAPQFKRALLEVLRGWSADLIHDNGLWSFTNHVAAQVASQIQIPFVLSTRGMLSPWALKHKSWKKSVAWHVYQRRDLERASVFHATSRQEAEDIRRLGFHQPIAVIPNGVELPECPPAEEKSPRTALFIGRIHPVKGLFPLIEAWAKVRPPGWRLILAGPDEENHQADVERKVQTAGLKEYFQFLGSVEGGAKEKLFREASLFVMPSYTENFGMAIAEALAHGLPVLTTKGTPWKDLPTRKCGWWTEPSADALAVALAEATRLTSTELGTMGQSGRKFIEEDFSWKKIGLEMRAVYEWVLGLRARPNCVWSGEVT